MGEPVRIAAVASRLIEHPSALGDLDRAAPGTLRERLQARGTGRNRTSAGSPR